MQKLPFLSIRPEKLNYGRTKAVFIDKDGTLIRNVPYNVDTSLIHFEEGAAEGLRMLKKYNFLLIVISNQAGIAKGYFSVRDLEQVYTSIQQKLAQQGVQLDAFYYCPHFPGGTVQQYSIECDCRKPKPGLILYAAKDFNVDLQRSWMVGDILHDIEAGNRAGCKTVLLDNGNETEWLMDAPRIPDFRVNDLRQAAELIVRNTSHRRSGKYDVFK